jgi:hypothetical protein
MILRRRSSSDATRAAAPASRNAMDPKKPASELPEPTERQRPQSSYIQTKTTQHSKRDMMFLKVLYMAS